MTHSHETRVYWNVFLITLCIFLLEVAGGVVSNSLSLQGDAWHVFTDVAATLIAILVAGLVRAGSPEKDMRFGGFAIQTSLLLLVAFLITLNAYDRYRSPPDVEGGLMLIVAILGLLGNWWQHHVLQHGPQNINAKALDLHIMGDLISSIGVIFASVVILATGWYVIDPLISFGIAAWLVVQVIRLWRGGHHH